MLHALASFFFWARPVGVSLACAERSLFFANCWGLCVAAAEPLYYGLLSSEGAEGFVRVKDFKIRT